MINYLKRLFCEDIKKIISDNDDLIFQNKILERNNQVLKRKLIRLETFYRYRDFTVIMNDDSVESYLQEKERQEYKNKINSLELAIDRSKGELIRLLEEEETYKDKINSLDLENIKLKCEKDALLNAVDARNKSIINLNILLGKSLDKS